LPNCNFMLNPKSQPVHCCIGMSVVGTPFHIWYADTKYYQEIIAECGYFKKLIGRFSGGTAVS